MVISEKPRSERIRHTLLLIRASAAIMILESTNPIEFPHNHARNAPQAREDCAAGNDGGSPELPLCIGSPELSQMEFINISDEKIYFV